MEKLYPIFNLAARVFLSFIFIFSGFGKITGYAGTQGYMESQGVPGILLPLVILLEVGGGLAVLLGWQARIAAFLLAGFSLLSGLLFHFDPENQMQMTMLIKNVAIAGGMLLITVHGAGAYSLEKKVI